MPSTPPDNTDPFFGVSERLAELVVRYYDGALSDDESADLRAGLKQSPAARDLFVQWGLQIQTLTEALSPQYREADEPVSFERLVEMEARAEAELVDLDVYAARSAKADLAIEEGAGGLSAHDMVAVGGYVLRKALTSRPALFAYAAAVVLLVGVLMVPWNTEEDAGSPPIVEQQDQPNNTTTPVATLTAEHNAEWDSQPGEDLRPGDALAAGQRLNLTQGFAEITTEEGAVVILEAPASVEFFDNDNAIRLHAGKLVGICETESSKGFVVRTPHMDITDLGTRFGVDASKSGATEVHVFDGEVRATRGDTEPVLLLADQSARASTGVEAIAAISHAPQRFAAILEESGLTPPTPKTVLDTDTSGTQWLITTSQYPGSVEYLGNLVTCTVDTTDFRRGVTGGNAYGFIQHAVDGAGVGKPATATGMWTFSNLPAGRYDVATAFDPNETKAVRYTVNGAEVMVDQSTIPAADAGPGFTGGVAGYAARVDDIQFTLIGSSIVVPEGGTITVTIDNSDNEKPQRSSMDSVAITRASEPN
jgi:ferric-dicitrate binding protein FerR (iron transport regulator)